ncbi:Uncharacterized protein XB16_2430 [Leptospira santarosai]|uniref:Uncharacterized protein n=1 Tax=Leptospira santarosai TaxID=28183 RepID=A0A2P1QV14_9LEPT|nr:Uncharacterized protein XB16_2430 [Leptospira santarosai]
MSSFLRIIRPLTLFAELNDTALYGSQRQVLGHAVSSKTKYVKELKKEKYSPQKKCGESFVQTKSADNSSRAFFSSSGFGGVPCHPGLFSIKETPLPNTVSNRMIVGEPL